MNNFKNRFYFELGLFIIMIITVFSNPVLFFFIFLLYWILSIFNRYLIFKKIGQLQNKYIYKNKNAFVIRYFIVLLLNIFIFVFFIQSFWTQISNVYDSSFFQENLNQQQNIQTMIVNRLIIVIIGFLIFIIAYLLKIFNEYFMFSFLDNLEKQEKVFDKNNFKIKFFIELFLRFSPFLILSNPLVNPFLIFLIFFINIIYYILYFIIWYKVSNKLDTYNVLLEKNK